MRKARFLVPWKDSAVKPAIYHCVSRVVEAVGGGKKGNGKKAREGLVRAFMGGCGAGFEAERWKEVSRIYRRTMGMALGRKSGRAGLGSPQHVAKNEAQMLASTDNETVLPDLGMAKMLRCRVRYFTDGAVIGSKEFVNEAFAGARDRFSERRKDGARRRKDVSGVNSTPGSVQATRLLRLRASAIRAGVRVAMTASSVRPGRVWRSCLR